MRGRLSLCQQLVVHIIKKRNDGGVDTSPDTPASPRSCCKAQQKGRGDEEGLKDVTDRHQRVDMNVR